LHDFSHFKKKLFERESKYLSYQENSNPYKCIYNWGIGKKNKFIESCIRFEMRLEKEKPNLQMAKKKNTHTHM